LAWMIVEREEAQAERARREDDAEADKKGGREPRHKC